MASNFSFYKEESDEENFSDPNGIHGIPAANQVLNASNILPNGRNLVVINPSEPQGSQPKPIETVASRSYAISGDNAGLMYPPSGVRINDVSEQKIVEHFQDQTINPPGLISRSVAAMNPDDPNGTYVSITSHLAGLLDLPTTSTYRVKDLSINPYPPLGFMNSQESNKAANQKLQLGQRPKAPYKCDYCDKVYSQKTGYSLLKTHILNNHTCPHCPEKFTGIDMLRPHMQKHLNRN